MIVTTVISEEVVLFDKEDYLTCMMYNMSVKFCKNNYKLLRFGRGPLVDQIVSRFIMKAPQGMLVDHRDGNPLNLTKDNMRLATRQQNSCNHLGNSGRNLPKGVTNNGNNFGAQITHNGKRIWLGTFTTCAEAEAAYKQAAELYQKEFAAHLSRKS